MQPSIKSVSSSERGLPESHAAANVHFHKLRTALSKARTRAAQAQKDARLVVNAIRSQMRSLVPRIEYIRFHKLDQFLRFGKMVEVRPDQTLEPNRRTNARIRDTQLLQKNLPWVTVVDCHLFLEGWNRGYEFAQESHISDSCIQSTDTHAASPIAVPPAERESYDSDLESGQISSGTPATIEGVARKLK